MLYMKDIFENWLQTSGTNNGKPYRKPTINNYLISLKTYVTKLNDDNIKDIDLFTVCSLDQFVSVYEQIRNSKGYKPLNQKLHNIFSSSLSAYHTFLSQLSILNQTENFNIWLSKHSSEGQGKVDSEEVIKILRECQDWLGIELVTPILYISSVSLFDSVVEEIKSQLSFENIDLSHGNGDISRSLELYREFIKENETSSSLSHGDDFPVHYSSWTIVNDTTAVKRCDNSFFDYNVTIIPQGLYGFFDAEDLEADKSKEISLFFEGNTYTGTVVHVGEEPSRIRLSWKGDFGGCFSKYKSAKQVSIQFVKKSPGVYEVSIIEEGDGVSTDIKTKLEQIKSFIESEGFSYEEGLIENFYLCLKTKPFVILAGTSGTGKTRLVKLFAKAIGATTKENRFKLVSVRPDWSDSTDLFGHVDLNGKFVPGVLLDFIQSAEADPEHPYFLCLDEMNLARVEYYLSDFLSIMETRDWSTDKHIITDPLVTDSYYGGDEAAIKKYGTICMPENLYLVGTVNMDETTFPFSRKVLDRANTIEFSYVDLLTTSAPEPPDPPKALDLGNDFLRSEYLLLKDCAADGEIVEDYCQELQAINEILQKAGAHVGYRVRDEIVFYLLNNRTYGLLDADVAMDNALMQKILPRIQGSSHSIKEILCDLFKECVGDFDGHKSESGDVYSKMKDVLDEKPAKYPMSARKIAFMVRRFEEDGFTSYWL